jgi:hypothetical protein
MKAAALPANETDRLKSLAAYQILDTLPEGVYDDITQIASEIAGTPIALLNIVDANRNGQSQGRVWKFRKYRGNSPFVLMLF